MSVSITPLAIALVATLVLSGSASAQSRLQDLTSRS
jgi:hypothetical protein